MNTKFFRFLEDNKLSEPHLVNRLFVSAFLLDNHLRADKDSFLYKYQIEGKNENEIKLLHDVIIKIHENVSSKLTIEDLINLFEFVISPSDRIVSGAIYTPARIREKIINNCLQNFDVERLKTVRVADIACGCGGFLVDVALYINNVTSKRLADIFTENLFGIDIQDYSIERTKILLSLCALLKKETVSNRFNLLVADTLDYQKAEWSAEYSGFDVIVGNPPYVCSRNLEANTRTKMLNYEVCKSGHPDLYIPFFQIAYNMLNEDGVFGYITMNSFIRSINGRSVRNFFSTRQCDIFIEDFRGFQIFKSKSTYTCLFYLKKGILSDCINYAVNEYGNLNHNLEYKKIPYVSVDDAKGWNLNTHEESSHVERIGIPIGKYCQYRHGIATLSNKTYIFTPLNDDEFYYFFYVSGKRFAVEKDICRDVINSNRLNSDVDFASIVEKLIYPYQLNDDGKVVVIDENMMQSRYPKAYSYFLSQKDVLLKRDKGDTSKYPVWYAYGRTQSLKMPRYKLFFPKFANKELRCVLCDDEKLMLYNGMAFVSGSIDNLQILQKVMQSCLFWNYVVKNAKPYASNYYSLSGVDIKNFGIPVFTDSEKTELLSLDSKCEVDAWLKKYYE